MRLPDKAAIVTGGAQGIRGRSIIVKVFGQRMTAQVHAAGNPDAIAGCMASIACQPYGGRGDIVHVRQPSKRRLALIGAPHSRPLQQGL
jgi:hypothetical protein